MPQEANCGQASVVPLEAMVARSDVLATAANLGRDVPVKVVMDATDGRPQADHNLDRLEVFDRNLDRLVCLVRLVAKSQVEAESAVLPNREAGQSDAKAFRASRPVSLDRAHQGYHQANLDQADQDYQER